MRFLQPLAVCFSLCAVLIFTGCHSAYVEATVKNTTGGPITLLEVDYPSASFGKEAIPADGIFHYRFKILGNGATKVNWTDDERKEHSITGPSLSEGQEGTVTITLTAQSATWDTQLYKSR